MKPLFTESQLDLSNPSDLLLCSCYQCNKPFEVEKRFITHELKNNRKRYRFCSTECHYSFHEKRIECDCPNCGKKISRKVSATKKSKNLFCSQSCAATYNNTHKTKGTRRSKLEVYLEGKLKELYPDLDMDFNKTNAINSELDIYIPSLKLAIELNGIFHYEPIFGEDKLNQIQNNDDRKFQACYERGIELCIIDTSQQKYFKEKTSKKFLHIITEIIDKKSLNI